MSILIVVMGLAMAVAGLVALVSGVPYMRLEFGWTEVIAGSTALSAGLVVVSVGAVLAALSRLTRAVERGASVARSSAPAEPQASRVRKARPVAADEEAEVTAPNASPQPLPLPSSDPEPDPAGPFADEAPPPPERRSLLGRFVRAKAGSRTPRAEPGVAALGDVVPASAFVGDAAADGREPPAGASLAAVRPGSDADVADGADPHGEHDAAHGPTVMGRYEAGGASYVLFSDGTIEVETETGVHRFGSMAELKGFIEHGEG